MYLWGSHLEWLDSFTHNFNKSIDFDQVLYKEDIEGSIAHVKMLFKIGLLNLDEKEEIINNLKTILNDIDAGTVLIDLNEEDIHSFIENELTKRVGDNGKKLHTGRSRNDQCAVDLRLFVKKHFLKEMDLLKSLIKAIINIAMQNINVIMPGFTHMQHAQVTTVAHWIMAYAQMLFRDLKKLKNMLDIMDENPLGSGALATTSFNLDRFLTTEILGFRKPTENSMDTVADRDYLLDILYVNSLIMTHMSRLCEELIYFASEEFSYVKFSESFSTGSSIMPQKKNPDMAELIRGKTGRVYGDLFSLFTILKGTPLSYNKDFQEDKEKVFDSINTIESSLVIMKNMLETLSFNKNNLRIKAEAGYLTATDLADYLVYKNIPFRQAYSIVGNIVNYAIEQNLKLDEIDMKTYKNYSDIFEDDLYEFINIDSSLKNRNVYGGPAPESVKIQINNLKTELELI